MKVSVEYAHTNLAAVDTVGMRKSVAVARAVIRHLRAQGHDVQAVVLLDDKKVELERVADEVSGFLALVDELELSPDEIFSESQLRNWLPELTELLPLKQGRKLHRSADSYLKQYNNLPCSVDIALWHTLRLGLLGDAPVGGADVVVSILDNGNREFEELARTQLLDYVRTPVAQRIITLYYPESPQTPADISALLHELDTAMKEISSCQAS